MDFPLHLNVGHEICWPALCPTCSLLTSFLVPVMCRSNYRAVISCRMIYLKQDCQPFCFAPKSSLQMTQREEREPRCPQPSTQRWQTSLFWPWAMSQGVRKKRQGQNRQVPFIFKLQLEEGYSKSFTLSELTCDNNMKSKQREPKTVYSCPGTITQHHHKLNL